MSKIVSVAAVQMQMSKNVNENIEKAKKLAKAAVDKGAQIILLPELFERQYFCQEKNFKNISFSQSVEENLAVKEFTEFAKENKVVIPVSFYERAGLETYNSVAVIDADGTNLGVYRKTHIPDDQFYQEKFYFKPGNTGFKIFKTKYATIGIGICWDQWFPEAARILTLKGAEIIFYPTAIGSEPIFKNDNMGQWRRVMQGHSAANDIPVVAANRIGEEKVTPCEENNNQESSLLFFGSSFITDFTGEILESLGREEEGVIVTKLNLTYSYKAKFGGCRFRDRRPEYYTDICK